MNASIESTEVHFQANSLADTKERVDVTLDVIGGEVMYTSYFVEIKKGRHSYVCNIPSYDDLPVTADMQVLVEVMFSEHLSEIISNIKVSIVTDQPTLHYYFGENNMNKLACSH